MARESCFLDLYNSVKATYRLLEEVLPKIQTMNDLKGSAVSTASQEGGKGALVWLMMARWINF